MLLHRIGWIHSDENGCIALGAPLSIHSRREWMHRHNGKDRMDAEMRAARGHLVRDEPQLPAAVAMPVDKVALEKINPSMAAFVNPGPVLLAIRLFSIVYVAVCVQHGVLSIGTPAENSPSYTQSSE
jgi:hypothetical protein